MDKHKNSQGPMGKMAGLQVRHMIETIENQMAAGQDPMHLDDTVHNHRTDNSKTSP